MYGQIYKITNKVNNKVYIGQTVKSLDRRLNEHFRASERFHYKFINNESQPSSRLYPSIYKYGKHNFEIELVDTADSRDELNQKEIYYIELFNTTNPDKGYNIAPGGNGGPLFKGHTHTVEVRNKISSIFRGKSHSQEFIDKRMESVRNRGPKIQCLDDGKIYKNRLEVEKIFGGDMRHSLHNQGRFKGRFYIELDEHHLNGYTKIERLQIISRYKSNIETSIKEGHKKMGKVNSTRNQNKYLNKISNINTNELEYDYMILGMGKGRICTKYQLTMSELNHFLKDKGLHRDTYKRPDTSERNKNEAYKKRSSKTYSSTSI